MRTPQELWYQQYQYHAWTLDYCSLRTVGWKRDQLRRHVQDCVGCRKQCCSTTGELQNVTGDRCTCSQWGARQSCLDVLFPLATQEWFLDSIERISDLYVMPEDSTPRRKRWSLLHRDIASLNYIMARIDLHGSKKPIKMFVVFFFFLMVLILMQCVSRQPGNLLTGCFRVSLTVHVLSEH